MRGYANSKDERVSILEAESYGKKFIPGSNKYNPKKDMATISRQRNMPRANDKPDTTGTKKTDRMNIPTLKTPAPGANLDDKKLNANRPRSTMIMFNKEKGKSFVQQTITESKKVPGPSHYKTDNYKLLTVCAPLQVRKRC